jgi:hypothetical protein
MRYQLREQRNVVLISDLNQRSTSVLLVSTFFFMQTAGRRKYGLYSD